MKKNYTRHVPVLFLFLLSNVVAFAQQVTTFSFTNGVQTYTVPSGVTFLEVKVQGASGGAGTGTGGAAGGLGSEVKGRLAVTPGTILYIYVGSAGTAFSGGFNGGGTPSSYGGGGGGASDIRIGGTSTSNRVIVAAGGGGGGGGAATGYVGGAGGSAMGSGQDGAPSATLGGKGGTQAIGGPGAGASCTGGTTLPGAMGSFGQGANGTGSAGAGGGGFFGGGGGATNAGGGTCPNGAGGGGGGSSMVSTSVVSNHTITTGTISGNGSIEITTPQAPTAITTGHQKVSANTYQLKADVTPNGANTNVFFEYSNSPTLGSGVVTVAWTSNPILATSTGITSVVEAIGGFTANTNYYYRVKAVNSVGTTLGAILPFTTDNTRPGFISGPTQSISMCQNTKDFQLTSLLHAKDTDPAQSITWSVAEMPSKNGSLGGFTSANTAVAGSANITPGNAISYTPLTGFKGTETFKIQISDGKESDTIVFTATVNPLPAPIISRTGLQLTTGTFDIYQWYRNNIAIVGASTQNYTMTEGGDYHVTVTDVNGCIATSNIFKYPTVGVEDVDAPAIHTYPNPVVNVLHVDAPEGSKLSITGMDGKIAIAQAAGKVDVSKLVPGVYVLRIYSHTGSLLQTSKLIRAAE